jgi:hypothetical protein
MHIRGNVMIPYINRPDGDSSWNETDYERAMTWEARLVSLGVADVERKQLVLCAVMTRKFPGITYPEAIVKKLQEYSINAPRL